MRLPGQTYALCFLLYVMLAIVTDLDCAACQQHASGLCLPGVLP